MQNITFGKLHIPNYQANKENINSVISSPEAKKIARQALDNIDKKTGNQDVFLHVTKEDETDSTLNSRLNWYAFEITDKNNETLAQEIMLGGIKDSYLANFKRHMKNLESQVPQMVEVEADNLFDTFV